jgi:hypothetical protein
MHFKNTGGSTTHKETVVEKEVIRETNFIAVSGLTCDCPGIIPGSILSLETVPNRLVTIEFMGGTMVGAGVVSVLRGTKVIGSEFMNSSQSPVCALRFFDISPPLGGSTYMIKLSSDIQMKDVTMLVRQS